MRKTKPERNKFRSIQQNILSPNSESYYATHYTGSTIRSVGYNEGRVSRDIQPAGFSSKDSVGLESMFPRIASEFFKVQIPKEPPPLPIQVHQIDRREYNMAHDTVRPSQTSGLQIAKEPEYVDELPPQIVPDDVEYVDEVPEQIIPDVPEFIEPVAEKPLSRKERKALFTEQQAEEEERQAKADEKRFAQERAKKDEINRKARERRAQKKAEQEAALQEQPIIKTIKIKKGKA